MRRIGLVVVALAVVAAACGDSSGDGNGDPEAAPVETSTTTAPETTTVAPETTTAPTTAPPTTTAPTTAAPAIVPGEDPDVDAVVEAFTIAFDSESDFETKAPYLVDPTGLEQTVADYLATGESFGGVGVAVTAVVITGDQAEVTYDLLFAGNPSYRDQDGLAVLTDQGWQVPRDVFCGLMASARVGCPSE